MTDHISRGESVFLNEGMADPNCFPPSAMVQYMYGPDRLLGMLASHSRSAGGGESCRPAAPVPNPLGP